MERTSNVFAPFLRRKAINRKQRTAVHSRASRPMGAVASAFRALFVKIIIVFNLELFEYQAVLTHFSFA